MSNAHIRLLGKAEGQRMEFEDAAALREPFRIGQDVVSMLNADGGDVWVGVTETAGRAVQFEPIDQPATQQRSLRDFLVDSIEPMPSGSEVDLEIVEPVKGTPLLHIRAQPLDVRRPYALLRGGGRQFLTRVGAHLRPMRREEIVGNAVREEPGDKALQRALEAVRKEQNRFLEASQGTLLLHLRPEMKVDVTLAQEDLLSLFHQPGVIGDRRGGWNVFNTRDLALDEDPVHSWGSRGDLHVEVRPTGEVMLSLGLDMLAWKGEDVYPLALVESIVSGVRLAGFLYRENGLPKTARIVAALTATRLEGKTLRPGSPVDPRFRQRPGAAFPDKDYVLEPPVIFEAREVMENPDRCGMRLLRGLYAAFGYSEDALPPELDRRTGRLVLPE